MNLRTLLHRPVRDDVRQPDGRPAARPDGQPVVGWGSAEPASADPAADVSRYEALEAYLEAQMRRLRIPGASLVVIEGDRIVHSRGFGKARPGGEVPSPQTPFALGSTTKPVTALAVMQLAEAGKIELDAPVQRYLPWFSVADPQASARITVRHLLNQTSGMSMVAGTACLADPDGGPDAAERQARRLSSLKLSEPVGTRFQYCNLNYNLLGLIVEAASGRSYAEYVSAHIFEPLDMRRTYAGREAAKPAGLAVGHRYWFGVPVAAPDMPFPSSGLAAGGLVSTSEDMAHYLIAHLNGGRYGDTRVLSGAGVDELHRRVAEQRVMGAAVTGYGMGWFVNEVAGLHVVSHGGNVPDFSSFVGFLPEQGKGVVLLVNSDHGFPFILTEVGEGLLALLGGRDAPPIRLGSLPWLMRASLLIPFVQLAGVLATLRRVRRLRSDPIRHPSGSGVCVRHVLLPLIPNLTLAGIVGYLTSTGLLRFMRLYMPDLFWIARISGGFASVWSLARTALVLGSLRMSPSHVSRRPPGREP